MVASLTCTEISLALMFTDKIKSKGNISSPDHESAYQSSVNLILSFWKWVILYKKKSLHNFFVIKHIEFKLKVCTSITFWLIWFKIHCGGSVKKKN